MHHSPISQITFTAIDFESAGSASGKTDAPIQIGTTSWNSEQGITDTWMSYIHTDRDITWAAQKVHGISKDDLVEAPKMYLLWPEVKKRLANCAVVAHGHGTEKRFLRAFPGHGFGPWIDTLHLSRKIWPDLESHSLGSVCEHCNIVEKIKDVVPDKSWHDALFDAAASMILLEFIIQDHELTTRDLSTLAQ